ncbi:MAG: HD domain-containing phosphohydrolase [Eubacteriales bacterium]|nr:HD domain-containing phosphohydrolase [Eubacteriales bacterium]
MEDKRPLEKYHIIEIDLAKELAHGICVSNLAVRLGRELELSEEICYQLGVAGLVHDIGKLEMAKEIGPDSVNDRLRVEEMRYVRTHAGLGYMILREQGYPEEIQNWVLNHHENYDGSGYPSNKAGEEIPLGARILRICDVFAALTMDRPYRKAFDVATAIELMIAEVKNFDMKIFLKFLNVVNTEDISQLMERQIRQNLRKAEKGDSK